MMHVVAVVFFGAGLCLSGTAYSGIESVQGSKILVTGQSQPSSQQQEQSQEQARTSQETPSHSQFGGAEKDQAARERHHSQYPESAQHLGPQEQDQDTGSKGAGGGKTKPGHEDKSPDAVSGVGR